MGSAFTSFLFVVFICLNKISIKLMTFQKFLRHGYGVGISPQFPQPPPPPTKKILSKSA